MAHEKQTARRNQLIRLIHVGKRELGMHDDTYRTILLSIGNSDSTANLPVTKLEAVLEHMKKAGFKVRSKKGGQRAMAMDAESRKVRALWLFLHEIGAVKNPSEAALAAYVKRMVGIDALQWVNGEQVETVIEGLKKWAMRLLPAVVMQMAKDVRNLDLLPEVAARLNDAMYTAATRQTFEPTRTAYEMLQEAAQQAKVKR